MNDIFLFQSTMLLMGYILTDISWFIFFWEYLPKTLLKKHIFEVKSKDWKFQYQVS